MNQPAPPQQLRPLRRSLSPETMAFLASYREETGREPVPVHLMLVDDSGPLEVGKTACVRSGTPGYTVLGEYVTGDSAQVTCQACLELVHA